MLSQAIVTVASVDPLLVQLIFLVCLAHVDIMLNIIGTDVPGKKYYSSLASLSNCIREFSSRCRSAWLRLFPTYPQVGNVANNMPPRCISGRWGAAFRFEVYLLERPWDMIAAVLRDVFGAECQAPEDQAELQAGHIQDENSIEDKKARDVFL